MAPPPFLPACRDGEASGKEGLSRELSSVPSASLSSDSGVWEGHCPPRCPHGSPAAQGALEPGDPMVASSPSQLHPHPSFHLWLLAICTHPGTWLPTGKSLFDGPNCPHKLKSLCEGRAGRILCGSYRPLQIHMAKPSPGSTKLPSPASCLWVFIMGFVMR